MSSKVRLLFCRTLSLKEPLSFVSTPLLRLGAWSSWSHVALVMADGVTVIDATFTHGGVKRRQLADVLAASSVWEYLDVEIPDAEAAFAFAVAQIDKPYDWLGAMGLALHRDWQRPDAWWCSEFVEACLAAGGLLRFRVDARRVSQEDSWKVAAGVVPA